MRTAAKYNWMKTGKQVFYDKSTYETLQAMYPISFYDDFTGADVVIPATGADESGCKWTKKIVGAAPPTVAAASSTVDGFILCSLTNADQKQDAALHMDDQLCFSLAQDIIFEARVAVTTVPTDVAIASWGLWGAWADGGSAYRVGFECIAGGTVNCECDDNATDTSASSGETLSASEYHIYRIDCTAQTNIKFYIDGVRVCATSTFNNAASAANSKCQPHFGLYKASGTGVGVMSVDYCKIWMNRS